MSLKHWYLKKGLPNASRCTNRRGSTCGSRLEMMKCRTTALVREKLPDAFSLGGRFLSESNREIDHCDLFDTLSNFSTFFSTWPLNSMISSRSSPAFVDN